MVVESSLAAWCWGHGASNQSGWHGIASHTLGNASVILVIYRVSSNRCRSRVANIIGYIFGVLGGAWQRAGKGWGGAESRHRSMRRTASAAPMQKEAVWVVTVVGPHERRSRERAPVACRQMSRATRHALSTASHARPRQRAQPEGQVKWHCVVELSALLKTTPAIGAAKRPDICVAGDSTPALTPVPRAW